MPVYMYGILSPTLMIFECTFPDWTEWIFMMRSSAVYFLVRQVQFEVADATKRVYPDNYFDVVYSRDTILHIKDKLDLFQRFYVSDRNCEKPWCNMLDLRSNTSLNFALVQCSNGFVFFFFYRGVWSPGVDSWSRTTLVARMNIRNSSKLT